MAFGFTLQDVAEKQSQHPTHTQHVIFSCLEYVLTQFSGNDDNTLNLFIEH